MLRLITYCRKSYSMSPSIWWVVDQILCHWSYLTQAIFLNPIRQQLCHSQNLLFRLVWENLWSPTISLFEPYSSCLGKQRPHHPFLHLQTPNKIKFCIKYIFQQEKIGLGNKSVVTKGNQIYLTLFLPLLLSALQRIH